MDADFFDRAWRLRERGLSEPLWRALVAMGTWTALREYEQMTDDELEATCG